MSQRPAQQQVPAPRPVDGIEAWLSTPPVRRVTPPPAATAEVAPRPLPPVTGPLVPHAGVPVPQTHDRLPSRPQDTGAPLWWLGVHGGAGESTLAGLLPWSSAAGHAWPTPLDPTTSARTVLVARTSMHGLQRAQRAAVEWASGSAPGIELLGLVLLADAPGRLPHLLRDFAALIAGGVPRTWHLPWQEAWRLGVHPATQAPTRPVQRLLRDLAALVPAPSSRARSTH